MKRKILSILMIVVCLACFSACNLVETDTQKDYKRTIATVTNSGYTDEISKLQLVNAVVNNFSYVQNGSYTVEALVDAMLDSLVQRRIVLQEGILYLTGKGEAGADEKKDTLTKYLKGVKDTESNTYTQKASEALKELLRNEKKPGAEAELVDGQIYADFYTAVNTLNDSFKSAIDTQVTSILSQMKLQLPAEDEDEKDDEEDKPTQRPTRNDNSSEIDPVEIKYPEDEDGNVIESAKEALEKEYYSAIPLYVEHLRENTPYVTIENEKEVPSKVTEAEVRKKAIDKVLSNLEDNYSGEGKYTFDKFYEEQLISQLENAVITKYQEKLDSQTKISLADMNKRRNEMIEAEKNQEAIDPGSYETRLSSVSDTSFVLYHPANGYGYVKHILLKFDSKQEAMLNSLKNGGFSKKDIEEGRAQLLTLLTVKDLTQFQEEGEIKYTLSAADGDGKTEGTIEYVQYATVWDTLLKLRDIPNISSFTYRKDADTDPVTLTISGTLTLDQAIVKAQVGIVDDKTVTEEDYAPWLSDSGLTETIGAMDFYQLFRDTFGAGDGNKVEDGKYVDTLYKTNDTSMDMINKFVDWIFRFNEDDGMFNNTVDYLSKPAVDVGENETFVTEFAEAARAVVEAGPGSYTLVPSDYGYHLVICTEKITMGQEETIDEDIVTKLQNGENLTADESATVTAKLYNIMISEQKNVLYENTIYSAIEVYKNGTDPDRNADTTSLKYRYEDLYKLGS